jgi:hypothetical protein
MSKAERSIVAGTVVELGPNLACCVHLDSGTVVHALIPRRIGRLM